MEVRFFDDTRAIESLRESDFDTVSAYGEVIDNAIEAEATRLNILFDTATRVGRPYEQIRSVAFVDNGIGMDAHTLHNCLTLGWSSRYNNRTGIGRFGVGMTLAAIHECKRVEVWTRTAGAPWRYTYLDLDEIANGALNSVPVPVENVPPTHLAKLVEGAHGTIVLWKDYDRQLKSADAIIDEFSVWCGRTFRYFLWGEAPSSTQPVSITINGTSVAAIDPLYARPKQTRWIEDPPATLYEPIELEWLVDTTVPGHEGRTSKIRIMLSKLPEVFRRKQGDGGSKAAVDRLIDENEGVSILRNFREVFFGPIPHWKDAETPGWPRFEEIDRWWGCEIHFSAELDRAFQVKNIKRGAVPVRPLKVLLKQKIKPTRESVLLEVREVHARTAQEEKQTQSEQDATHGQLPRIGDHSPAETIAKNAPVPPKNRVDEGKDVDKEAKSRADTYADRYDEEQRHKLAELFKRQPFTIMEQSWKGPLFYEAHFMGGTAALDYNKRHAFFVYLDGLLSQLNNVDSDPAALARRIRSLIDLLIMAHAKAEAQAGPDQQVVIEFLLTNWGQFLASYVTALENTREGEG